MRAIYSTPEVSRWLSATAQPLTRREIERKIARDLRHWDTNGIGRWYWREIDTEILVARCGPRLAVVCGSPEVELHWAVRPDRQGRGYATEAARAAARACFAALSLNSIVAYAHAENVASVGVMNRAGFLFERTFDLNGRPHVLHRCVSPGAG
jgi:RimJ/RimL family protein N-acetyltransferase